MPRAIVGLCNLPARQQWMGEDKYGDGCLGSIVIQHDPGIARDRQISPLHGGFAGLREKK